MKTILFACLVLITIFGGCKKENLVKGYYNYLHFDREGGGQIDFNVYPTDHTDSLKVVVDKYNFRDTTIQISIVKNTENASSFLLFHDAIKSQVQINGDFQQSTLPTGTWAYIYVVANGKETEVTNINLRNTLLNFEQLVRTRIQ